MKARALSLLVLGVFVGLVSVSCGRGQIPSGPSSPAVDATGPGAAGAIAETPPVGYGDEGDVSASTLAIAPFSFTDACNDNRGIALRFWEAQGSELTGRSTRILRIRSLGRLNVRLLCTKGRSNCVGATTSPAGGATWGVGLDGDGRPSRAYCRACASSPVTSIRFLCARRLGVDGTFADEGFTVDDE